MTATLPEFKRGDTFQLSCTYAEGGVATTVTGKTINAQIRKASGVLVSELVASSLNSPSTGKFLLKPSDPDTSEWAIGDMEIDIQITEGSNIRSTETFILPIVKDITR